MATLCTSGNVVLYAGSGMSSDIDTTNDIDVWISDSEGMLCAATNFDWVTNYGTLTANTKEILRIATASKAAMQAVMYNVEGYFDPALVLNVLRDNYTVAVEALKKEQGKNMLGAGS